MTTVLNVKQENKIALLLLATHFYIYYGDAMDKTFALKVLQECLWFHD